MALSWWASAVRSPDGIAFFDEAVADLHWVIQELIRVKTAPPSNTPPPQEELPGPRQPTPVPLRPKPTPRQPEPSTTPRPPASSSRPHASSSRPVSTSGVHTHQRTEGKRVVIPTWKAKATQ